MAAQFWPCPGCSRHVKRADAICPFCGAAASVEIIPTRALASRLSRAAIFAGAMGTGIATTDCGSTAVPYGLPPSGAVEIESTDASASDGPSAAAADTSTDAAPTDSSSGADVPMGIVFYGAAIIVEE